MASNYPPGVTGNEPQIAGCPKEYGTWIYYEVLMAGGVEVRIFAYDTPESNDWVGWCWYPTYLVRRLQGKGKMLHEIIPRDIKHYTTQRGAEMAARRYWKGCAIKSVDDLKKVVGYEHA